ncbi:hypothetical protein Acy02nite_15670 [Actinoplanes cyaneus]|uniref:Uncharacterized protein n=1 Tax=Actinoplanes cyaneus TaxID=52696 RepID=A0A919IG15_9ACTN|nr:hypothetical protein [Actinoplanes cyaneus]GID63686.1 hypothetical protein Acy02nite_15670 [Actinoplanes cyaneus]
MPPTDGIRVLALWTGPGPPGPPPDPAVFTLLAAVLHGALPVVRAIVAVRTVLQSRTVDPRPRDRPGYGRIAARIL